MKTVRKGVDFLDDWSNTVGMSMATPTDTRDRIVDAGSKAIVAKSYNGCGLNEILSAAGVPKGSFYHYFKSKEDFGVAVIERSGDEHAERLRAYLTDRSLSPVARIRAFYGMVRDYYAESGPTRECLIAKLALETAQLSEPMRAAIKCCYDHWAALHAKAIREAQSANEIPSDENPEHLANLLINAWEGATIRMQINRDVGPLNEFVDDTLERLLVAR